MTRRASTFRESDVKRAVKAARGAGVTVGAVEVTPNGTIRIVSASGEADAAPASPFDRWKVRQNAGNA